MPSRAPDHLFDNIRTVLLYETTAFTRRPVPSVALHVLDSIVIIKRKLWTHGTALDWTRQMSEAQRINRSDSTENPPHIVLIMADQLRADAMGFMGNPMVRTPNLDRLAARGVVFDQMHTQSSVCMPSRGAIATGRYPRTIRMTGSPLLDPRETTLQELLHDAGYSTGLFGKLHLTPQQYTIEQLGTNYADCDAGPFLEPAGLPPMDDTLKRHFGFEESVGYEDDLIGHYVDWVRERDPALAEQLPFKGMAKWPGRSADLGSPLGGVGQTIVPPELHPSTFIAESASEFFARRSSEGPCFMQVSFVDPHPPFDPPSAVAQNYPAEQIPLPRQRDFGNVDWPQRLRERTADYSSATEHATRTTLGYYYAMVEMLDRAVGQLIETIEARGEMDNTIFAFTADHGEYVGSYGLFKKGSYHYDCMTRMPAFISYPAKIPARRNAGLTQTIDLAPTLLSLAGQPVHPGMQGDDLAEPLMRGEEMARDWAYTELYDGQWGPFIAVWTLRTETAKLHYFPTDRRGYLFDLENDSDEQIDLYGDAGYRELRDNMHEMLAGALQAQNDPLPQVLSQY